MIIVKVKYAEVNASFGRFAFFTPDDYTRIRGYADSLEDIERLAYETIHIVLEEKAA